MVKHKSVEAEMQRRRKAETKRSKEAKQEKAEKGEAGQGNRILKNEKQENGPPFTYHAGHPATQSSLAKCLKIFVSNADPGSRPSNPQRICGRVRSHSPMIFETAAKSNGRKSTN